MFHVFLLLLLFFFSRQAPIATDALLLRKLVAKLEFLFLSCSITRIGA
ncbi:hypothetical protein SLEP1_g54328 [Rubroshorea leprosula]|uniref:Uncharacterized protein n=1 Tax=Rubroshorea leprosula TaxID=152421 RepID=A0AAV5MEI1_9ROSI|nr:hypothetical protein SLEP1_g54328 [Rubroshorea leprosula]